MKRTVLATVAVAAALGVAATANAASTAVPGHADRADADGNGFPDAGVVVTGKYTSVYAYDGNGDWYWDLGDGRVQGSVGSVAELDRATLTTCNYQVVYRGSFENDAFQDTGWISNQINCRGVDKGTFNSTYVSQTDPRYTGTGTPIWGTWEVHRDAVSKLGNLERPEKPAGA